MNKINKITVSVLVVALLVVGFLYYQTLGIAGIGNAVGTQNTSPRMVSKVCNNAASTTYVSFLNSDANARIITNVYVALITDSTSAWANLGMGTSTSPTATSTAGVFYIANMATTTGSLTYMSINATSTQLTDASTTYAITADNNRIWPTGTYLNAKANSTSTGYCNIRVDYIAE